MCLPEPGDGELLVRNVYLSLDPTHRIWMSDIDQYLPPVQIGEVMRGTTLGVVEASRSKRFEPGQVVTARSGWEDYSVVQEGAARRVPELPGVPLTAHMSVLGVTGLTAWFGMTDIGRPRPGETVVVSAAAGAVGSVAGQIAKLKGARVIGIAGGPNKCRWLVETLGFDGAIDYRGEDVGSALDRLCPSGVDLNFENVGGAIMDAVVHRMNNEGRMVLCGLISGYNDAGTMSGPSDFGRVLMRRILIKGFIVIDYYPRRDEALAELIPLVSDGKIKWKVHIERGLENAAEVVKRLFNGNHNGKLLLEISP